MINCKFNLDPQNISQVSLTREQLTGLRMFVPKGIIIILNPLFSCAFSSQQGSPYITLECLNHNNTRCEYHRSNSTQKKFWDVCIVRSTFWAATWRMSQQIRRIHYTKDVLNIYNKWAEIYWSYIVAVVDYLTIL